MDFFQQDLRVVIKIFQITEVFLLPNKFTYLIHFLNISDKVGSIKAILKYLA